MWRYWSGASGGGKSLLERVWFKGGRWVSGMNEGDVRRGQD